MRPSPARAEPHDSTTWLPLPDVDTLPEPDGLIATSTGASAAHSAAPPVSDAPAAPAPPSPARARPHDATAWFPLPVPDELPSIDEMLTQSPWEAKPSPARAEPHDAAAWLPLPDVTSLPAVEAVAAPPTAPTPARPGRLVPPAPPGPSTAAAPPSTPPPASRSTARRVARPRLALVALLVVATVVTGVVGLRRFTDVGSSVEVRVDGRRVSVDTGAATVGRLLRDQRVSVGEFDRVVPSASTPLRDGLTVTVLRAFPITRDLDGTIETVFTTYRSPSDYVRHELGDRGIVIRSQPRRLRSQSTIILRTPHSGRLDVDGSVVDYAIPALDVDELLAQYSIDLGPEDYMIDASGRAVGRDTPLVDGGHYSVVRVGREIQLVEETYSVPEERRPDPTMDVGQTRVDPGAPGIMSVSYEVLRRNGDEVERKTLSRVPTVVARPTVTYFGTRADPMWDKIAECETGGNWGMRGPLYSGGLGFYNGTWNGWGGHDFAPNAGLATREEQIIVAERVRADVGIGGWGCAHTLGYVR